MPLSTPFLHRSAEHPKSESPVSGAALDAKVVVQFIKLIRAQSAALPSGRGSGKRIFPSRDRRVSATKVELKAQFDATDNPCNGERWSGPR